MEKLQQLMDELRKLHKNFTEAQDKADEERQATGETTAETRALVDTLTEKVTALVKEVDEMRSLAAAPAPPTPEEEANEAAAIRASAMDKFLRRGFIPELFTDAERRALSEASDSDGAFFAPEEMENQITMNASHIAVIRPLANTGTTSRLTVVGPILSKPAVSWGQELKDIDSLTLGAGRNRMTIHDLTALWTISNNTLEDSEADIVGELSQAFGRVIAETEDTSFVAGTGAGQPEGIITNTSIQANYTATGVADALTNASNNGMDALISALTALKAVYRSSSTWLFNSATLGLIMKFKDGEGRYLWQPNSQEGAANMLLGRPTAVAEGMPDVAANAFPIVLGDLRLGYKIRDRRALTITRLNERYAEKDQVGFIVKKRVGGQPTLMEAFQCIKVATS